MSIGITPLHASPAMLATPMGPLDARLNNPSANEAQKIHELSQQFESLLLRQILKEIRQSVIPSGLFEESTSTDIYSDMINFHLAESISHSDNFGLAEHLERDLNRQHPPAHGQTPPNQADPGEP